MPWQLLVNHAKVLAVHAAYMGFGQILYFGGDQHDPKHNEAHEFKATCLFDCGSSAVTPIASPQFDAFCSGHAFVGASNVVKLLVGGGTEQFPQHAVGLHHPHFPGLKDAAIFSSPDFITPAAGGWDWTPAADMTPGLLASQSDVPNPDPRLTGGRWYPTLITLPNGDVIAFSGHPGSSDGSNSPGAEHNNCIPEIFAREPQPRGEWRRLASYSSGADRDYYESHATTYYPRMHLLPTGDILCTNPVRERTISFTPDVGPHGGMFYDVCLFPPTARDAFGAFSGGFAGTSVLLPLRHDEGFSARVMICGSFTDTPYILDLRGWNPSLSSTGAWNWHATGQRRMKERRLHANSVILPTGEIFVCGGIDAMGTPDDPALDSKGDLTRMPELYNPYSDTWDITREAATSVRNYHSVALLMPDGRVWTAGSNYDARPGGGEPPPGNEDNRNLDIEIYEPWYFADPGRPFITAAPSLAYPGDTILVKTTFATEIERVVIVRCGTSTHSFNPDQRMIELRFTNPVDDNLLVVMPPDNNIMPPGPYLIFTIRHKLGTLGLPSSGTDIYIVPEKRDRQRPHG
jgi:hypothetical protein